MLSLEGLQNESEQQKTGKPRWPDWTGQTAVVIATGPSLTAEQIERVRNAGVRVVAVNDVGLVQRLPIAAPWADVLYAADWAWWDYYRPRFEGLTVAGQKEPVERGLCDCAATLRGSFDVVETRPGEVIHGDHSGFQALQLPITWGATRVLLLGYDCKPAKDRTNYYGNKPEKIYKESPYDQWARGFGRLRIPQGVRVINCTPDSAIECFEKMELDAALA